MCELHPSEQVDVDHQQLQELCIAGDADGTVRKSMKNPNM